MDELQKYLAIFTEDYGPFIADRMMFGETAQQAKDNIIRFQTQNYFDKLDADLAHGLMGINAVKGVEIGRGFEVVSMRGTENRDEISPSGFMSNNSGGTTGGISTGQDIFASIALKPTSSIMSSGNTINKSGKSVKVQTKGRHDPCVGLRAPPIAEAMVAITLMDHFLRNRAQNADVKSKLKPIKPKK